MYPNANVSANPEGTPKSNMFVDQSIVSFVSGPPLARAINVSLVPQGIICSSDISIGKGGTGNVPFPIP